MYITSTEVMREIDRWPTALSPDSSLNRWSNGQTAYLTNDAPASDSGRMQIDPLAVAFSYKNSDCPVRDDT